MKRLVGIICALILIPSIVFGQCTVLPKQFPFIPDLEHITAMNTQIIVPATTFARVLDFNGHCQTGGAVCHNSDDCGSFNAPCKFPDGTILQGSSRNNNVLLTATPTIATTVDVNGDPIDNARHIFIAMTDECPISGNVGGTCNHLNCVTLQDKTNLAGSHLQLFGTNVTLCGGDAAIELAFDGADWVRIFDAGIGVYTNTTNPIPIGFANALSFDGNTFQPSFISLGAGNYLLRVTLDPSFTKLGQSINTDHIACGTDGRCFALINQANFYGLGSLQSFNQWVYQDNGGIQKAGCGLTNDVCFNNLTPKNPTDMVNKQYVDTRYNTQMTAMFSGFSPNQLIDSGGGVHTIYANLSKMEPGHDTFPDVRLPVVVTAGGSCAVGGAFCSYSPTCNATTCSNCTSGGCVFNSCTVHGATASITDPSWTPGVTLTAILYRIDGSQTGTLNTLIDTGIHIFASQNTGFAGSLVTATFNYFDLYVWGIQCSSSGSQCKNDSTVGYVINTQAICTSNQ